MPMSRLPGSATRRNSARRQSLKLISRRILAPAAGLALFAWYVFLIRGGLASWFSADDLMNMHYYWSGSWSALIKANVFFWTSYYRPAGGLFYRIIYALGGFHPLPFRIAALMLLCAN